MGVEITGKTKRVVVTPVLAVAGAYASGDAVGTNFEIPFLDSVTPEGERRSGILQAVAVTDASANPASALVLDLVLFDRAFITQVDNAPFTPVDADLPNFLAVVKLSANEHSLFGAANSVLYRSTLAIPFVSNSGSLHGGLVARAAPTFVTGGLRLIAEILLD